MLITVFSLNFWLDMRSSSPHQARRTRANRTVIAHLFWSRSCTASTRLRTWRPTTPLFAYIIIAYIDTAILVMYVHDFSTIFAPFLKCDFCSFKIISQVGYKYVWLLTAMSITCASFLVIEWMACVIGINVMTSRCTFSSSCFIPRIAWRRTRWPPCPIRELWS